MSLYGRIFAAGYDRVFARAERAGLAQMRAAIVARARGRTLEIGAGTGLNLGHYPRADIDLVLTEPEAPMARRLERRARAERPDADVVRAPADALPFGADSFDTVVATLVLCTVPDPAAALAEARRVLRPGGSLLFLEHVRSQSPRTATRQDRLQPLWLRVGHGCHCNRDTLAAIRSAGFDIPALQHTTLPLAPAFLSPLIIGAATTA